MGIKSYLFDYYIVVAMVIRILENSHTHKNK